MQHNWEIPWSGEKQWDEVVFSITHVANRHKAQGEHLETMAKQIGREISNLSDSVEQVCLKTCVACNDICCRKATIWYDLKDLLSLYYAGKRLPRSQMEKQMSRHGMICCHLSESGCALPRDCRPFVCTWYFCAGQNRYLEQYDPELKHRIAGCLADIKRFRNSIEKEFIRISAGQYSPV